MLYKIHNKCVPRELTTILDFKKTASRDQNHCFNGKNISSLELFGYQFSSVQLSRSVVSNSLRYTQDHLANAKMATLEKAMAPHSSTLAWKIHGWRSLVGCSSWGHELDMTEQLHFHFSLSCTGEGNGNPLQCSCLENPRDGRVWWAAVYGVAQS